MKIIQSFLLAVFLIYAGRAFAGGAQFPPGPGSQLTIPVTVANGGTGATSGALSQMEKLSAVAATDNLMINAVTSAATITTPGSAPSTTGLTDLLNGHGFVTNVTGNTTAGSSVVSGISSMTGLVVGMPVVEATSSGFLLPTHIQLGSVITAVNSGASTITLSKPALANGSSITARIFTDLLTVMGGVPCDYSNNAVIGGTSVTSATPSFSFTPQIYEFETDAANFSTSTPTIIFSVYQNGASPNNFRVAIDGAYQSSSSVAFTNSGSNWITIQFAAAGIHRVRVELATSVALNHLYVYTGAMIQQSQPASAPRVAFFGDSYFDNASTGSWPLWNIASRTADLLGWLPDFLAVGGTGYYSNGSVNYAWSSPYRTGNVNLRNYAAVVFFGSVNDAGATSTQEQAAALATWQAVRTNLPYAPIIIFGVPTTTNTTSATATTLETGLAAAFAQWGDNNAWYFPITTDPDGAWLNSNNISTYIASDGTHPEEPLGENFLAGKMTQKIRTVLNQVPF